MKQKMRRWLNNDNYYKSREVSENCFEFFEVNETISICVGLSEELGDIFSTHFLTNFCENLFEFFVWDQPISISIQQIECYFQFILCILERPSCHEFSQNWKELIKLDGSILIEIRTRDEILDFMLTYLHSHLREEMQNFLEY